MSTKLSSSNSPTLELARQLIQQASVTPEDADCQKIMCQRLSALGFEIEHLPFEDVRNFWAVLGDEGPLFVFAGHTDVVPAGPESQWQFPPFSATVHEGRLYGRGAADMKGSLAAMITAVEALLGSGSAPKARIGFLITSDEEGIAINGTRKVMDELQARGTHIDYCLVGEPSSSGSVGDSIKIGRRGSLSGRLSIKGIQGHVAYPELALNPIHKALPALGRLTAMEWDQGNDSFPPTSFQISNFNAGTGANNVIPEQMVMDFNLRYSTETNAEAIKQTVELELNKDGLDYEIQWHLSGEPFLTSKGLLIDTVKDAISEICGLDVELSTAGGTSDGRFIAPTGTELVELGPVNASIHKIDENVAVSELETLSEVYQRILQKLPA
jgi:succinyl-diaminopimelate desuccinylase